MEIRFDNNYFYTYTCIESDYKSFKDGNFIESTYEFKKSETLSNLLLEKNIKIKEETFYTNIDIEGNDYDFEKKSLICSTEQIIDTINKEKENMKIADKILLCKKLRPLLETERDFIEEEEQEEVER